MFPTSYIFICEEIFYFSVDLKNLLMISTLLSFCHCLLKNKLEEKQLSFTKSQRLSMCHKLARCIECPATGKHHYNYCMVQEEMQCRCITAKESSRKPKFKHSVSEYIPTRMIS